MGKSLKNSVTPDDMYASYGADTLRLYEMAMGPLDADRPWQTDDVVGVYRFLQRLWRGMVDERTGGLHRGRRRAGRRHRAARAAPDHPGGTRELRRAAVQPRDRPAAGTAHPRGPHRRRPGQAAAGGRGAAGADGRAARAAHRRGALGPPRPRRVPSPTRRSPRPDPALPPSRRSCCRSRSTARPGCGSRSRPTPAPSRSARSWPATPTSPGYVGGAAVDRLVVVPGRIANVVTR